jgi:hypothetical protein
MPYVLDDVIEVIAIVTIFSLPAILSYQPDAYCRWPMLLLQSELFLLDHSIGYHQRAHPIGYWPLGPLR